MKAQLTAASSRIEQPLLAGLIRTELLEWMHQLTESYSQLDKLVLGGKIHIDSEVTLSFDKAKVQTELLRQKMDLLARLAESYTEARSDNRERLQLADLISAAINPGGPLGHLGKRFELPFIAHKLGPIYANREWLELTLIHLLTELHKGTPVGRRIVLTLKQLGNFQVLVTHDADALRTGLSHSAASQVVREIPKLSFSFCRRIVDLHGGTLRLESERDKDVRLSSFTLSLPTGDDSQSQQRTCVTCPLTAQVERYAEDLAELMERCQQLELQGGHHG